MSLTLAPLITLPESEAYQLASCEGRIEAGLSSFIEVGEALSAIREGKLYRATHGTFEDYCKAKWNLNKRYCDRLIEAKEIVKNLGPMGPEIKSERQARELSRVEPARREEVVAKAVEATGGKLTASAIREAAQPVEQAPQVIEMTPAAKSIPRISTAETSEAEQLWGVARSRLDNIRKNDPKRERILSEVIRYATNRIEGKK